MTFSDITVTSSYLTLHSPSFVFPFFIPPKMSPPHFSPIISHLSWHYPSLLSLHQATSTYTQSKFPFYSFGFFSYTRTSEDLDIGVSDEREHVIFVFLSLGYHAWCGLFYLMTYFWMNCMSLKRSRRKLKWFKSQIKIDIQVTRTTRIQTRPS